MRELVDAQRGGLRSKPTMILPELPGQVDEIFTRALAFEPEKRYQKARDFGEAIYNALGNFAMSDEILVIDDTALVHHGSAANEFAVSSPGKVEAGNDVLELSNPVAEVKDAAPVHASPAPAWEKRAAESQRMSGWAIATAGLIVLLLIAGGIFAYLNYFTGAPISDPPPADTSNGQVPVDANQAVPPTAADADSIPQPREITPPAGSVAFQNSKDDLPAALKKNFRGFSVYYPGTWVKNKSDKNFLDISRSTENGTPIEQILVSWYESKGTFTEDSANFPKLAKALNDKWSESIPNFQAVSQGEDFVNGRKVFQVKFQGEGETNTGEKITIWGRTLFMPPGRYGQKNGFVITMLATSHSPEVLSADDVGTKGELKEILYSFEAAPLDPAV